MTGTHFSPLSGMSLVPLWAVPAHLLEFADQIGQNCGGTLADK